MTQEQKKAKEIFDKFNKIKHSVSTHVQKERSKQCAIIAVDEILSICTSGYFINYWQEVKQEIEKL